ncbi:SGNH/GDSL hydrolase family protein [Paraliomyxa miuraensis]|uniref:SGNH/GDSL hydrolase family protein n=1 Tax=Paraliomyxa miuraensis TaxID=376150 RepID=UPI00225685EC|nr:SGNH/GDSL hydrolase family protein [Paraliomyxa miuraensis]MCX4242071.1 SGNH/GDSL hydrolase family protein [Paraliomyxa miuraensis]
MTGASIGTTGETDTETDGLGPPPDPLPYEPARYPGHQTHSPITPYVADRMREIALLGPEKHDDVFMKIGASSTVSHNTLYCFAEGPYDLAEHDELQPTLDFFLGGDAAGTTPFDRPSEAARVGHHAGWAISGDPSPIDIEVELLSPRLALVHFGANDMGWGETYGDALLYFHSNMMILTDGLIDQGIVPILFGITRRGDYASAQRWVDTWNATIRVIAQARQVPYVDLYNAIDWLPGHGLAGDGLHLEAYSGGACILDEEGLQHGYNIRNLVALEVLDRSAAVLVDEAPGLEPPQDPLLGDGTPEAPWVIDQLPFGDVVDTAQQGLPFIDQYTGCNNTADESGPELWYRLELTETKRLRAAVLDMEGVDVDVHLLDETGTAEGCIERGHHFVEGTLEPGTYHFVLDSWVNDDGVAQAGEVLFVLLECAAGDSACN